jgi:hypothetical protein
MNVRAQIHERKAHSKTFIFICWLLENRILKKLASLQKAEIEYVPLKTIISGRTSDLNETVI